MVSCGASPPNHQAPRSLFPALHRRNASVPSWEQNKDLWHIHSQSKFARQKILNCRTKRQKSSNPVFICPTIHLFVNCSALYTNCNTILGYYYKKRFRTSILLYCSSLKTNYEALVNEIFPASVKFWATEKMVRAYQAKLHPKQSFGRIKISWFTSTNTFSRGVTFCSIAYLGVSSPLRTRKADSRHSNLQNGREQNNKDKAVNPPPPLPYHLYPYFAQYKTNMTEQYNPTRKTSSW